MELGTCKGPGDAHDAARVQAVDGVRQRQRRHKCDMCDMCDNIYRVTHFDTIYHLGWNEHLLQVANSANTQIDSTRPSFSSQNTPDNIQKIHTKPLKSRYIMQHIIIYTKPPKSRYTVYTINILYNVIYILYNFMYILYSVFNHAQT